MRCMACGAEMSLIDVAQDAPCRRPGFEHHSFTCSACGDAEPAACF